MKRSSIRLAVNGHGLYSQFATGPDYPKSNLAAIRNQNFAEQNISYLSTFQFIQQANSKI